MLNEEAPKPSSRKIPLCRAHLKGACEGGVTLHTSPLSCGVNNSNFFPVKNL